MGFSAGKIIKTKGVRRPSEVVDSKAFRDTRVDRARTEAVNQHDHAVIVNGKQKKISKKSAFLLDMLTLDDE